jgi:hypothetical protein
MTLQRLLSARTASGDPLISDVASRQYHSDVGSPPTLLSLLRELSPDLLVDTLTAVIRTDAIVQSRFQTCGFSSVEYTLARNQPAEYVRIIAELANYGRAELLRGQPLVAGTGDDWVMRRRSDDGRVMSSRLFQSAAMHTYSLAGYDIARDRWGPSDVLFGAYPWEVSQLLWQLTGRMHRVSLTVPSIETLNASSHGSPSFVMLSAAFGLHFLNVVGTRGEGDAVRVILRNPWGAATTQQLTESFGFSVEAERGPAGYISMSLADFRAHMASFIQ